MDNARCYSEYEAARLIGLTYEALVKRRKRGIGPQCGTGWPGGGPKYSLHDLSEYKRPRGCQPHAAPDISRLGWDDFPVNEIENENETDQMGPHLIQGEITLTEVDTAIKNAVIWIAGKRSELALGISNVGQIVIEFENERLPDMPGKKRAVELYNTLVRIRHASATKGQRPGEQPGRLGERVRP